MRAAKVQASLRICTGSPEPSLLAHTSSESRGTFRQKTRSLALLNGWACAVKICHDGMLEDTNSLDGAQLIIGKKSSEIHSFNIEASFETERISHVKTWNFRNKMHVNSYFHWDWGPWNRQPQALNKWATSWENRFMSYPNNKDTAQPAHLRSLISTFVVRCLDSIIPTLAKSLACICSWAAGLCLTVS